MAKKKDKQPKVIERKLGREKAVGLAHFDEKLIEIDPRQKPFEYLETLVHEKYHLQFPKLPEEKILKLGHEMAKLLWSVGYRKVSLK